MPKDPFVYVNGINDTLDAARKRMKGYNRRYLRDMGTVLKAEKGLLSRESLDKYSPRQLKEMVQQRIRRKGLADPAHGGRLPIRCKDKKLRYYRPDVWAETMARTRSRALQEEGLHNQMVNAGFDLVQVSIGGSGDPCTNWEGSILSITGKTPGYPTVDDAQGSGEIFHPRCVHSSNPFLLTEDENGPKVWGRDDLTPRAREQLKHAGVTRKGTIQTGVKVVMGTTAKKKVLNMVSTNIPKTHKEAMQRAKAFSQTVFFTSSMPLDQLNDAIVAMEDSLTRFPTKTLKGKKLTFFGSKDAARRLNPHLGSWKMGKYVNAQYVHWTKGDDVIVFRKHMLRGRSKLTDTRFNLTVDKVLAQNKNVSPAVLKIVEKSGAARAWCISTTHGTRATIYHEYGHRIYYNHPRRKQLQDMLVRTYREGWPYALSEYSRTSIPEYFAEAFSAYMSGFNHLLSPELLSWFKENDTALG